MAPKARIRTPNARELRGADGLRGVRSRHAGSGRSSRASSGRGPTSVRARRDVPAGPPRATDRVEHRGVAGLGGTLATRLFAPHSTRPLPLIVAWGLGGTATRDLHPDDAWARELSDLTGAIVLLAGYRRADEGEADTDAATVYAELTEQAATVGADPARIAVSGRGAGFRVAARLAASAEHWPTLPAPRVCVAATPVPVAAAALRDALALPAPPRPSHAIRVGSEVFTLDGHALGRVGAVRDGDVFVRRNLSTDGLYVPLRAIHRAQGALTLSLRAAEVAVRDWGRGAAELPPPPDHSRN